MLHEVKLPGKELPRQAVNDVAVRYLAHFRILPDKEEYLLTIKSWS